MLTVTKVIKRSVEKGSETLDSSECTPLSITLTKANLPEYIATSPRSSGLIGEITSTNCPIALFLRQYIKAEYEILVSAVSLLLSHKDKGAVVGVYEILLPVDAVQWICLYDKWQFIYRQTALSRANDSAAKKQELAAMMFELNVTIDVPTVCLEM